MNPAPPVTSAVLIQPPSPLCPLLPRCLYHRHRRCRSRRWRRHPLAAPCCQHPCRCWTAQTKSGSRRERRSKRTTGALSTTSWGPRYSRTPPGHHDHDSSVSRSDADRRHSTSSIGLAGRTPAIQLARANDCCADLAARSRASPRRSHQRAPLVGFRLVSTLASETDARFAASAFSIGFIFPWATQPVSPHHHPAPPRVAVRATRRPSRRSRSRSRRGAFVAASAETLAR